MHSFKIIVPALCCLLGHSAAADGVYYGGGLFYTDATSLNEPDGTAESADSYFGVSGTVGYRWDQPTSFFGAEADIDLPIGSDFEANGASCEDSATDPYYCTHNATIRLRGLAGIPVGNFEGFASAGFTIMTGDGAVSPNEQDTGVNTGFTVGVGLQQDLGGNTLRYELIYDNAENTATKPTTGPVENEPTFEALTVKVTILFN